MPGSTKGNASLKITISLQKKNKKEKVQKKNKKEEKKKKKRRKKKTNQICPTASPPSLWGSHLFKYFSPVQIFQIFLTCSNIFILLNFQASQKSIRWPNFEACQNNPKLLNFQKKSSILRRVKINFQRSVKSYSPLPNLPHRPPPPLPACCSTHRMGSQIFEPSQSFLSQCILLVSTACSVLIIHNQGFDQPKKLAERHLRHE